PMAVTDTLPGTKGCSVGWSLGGGGGPGAGRGRATAWEMGRTGAAVEGGGGTVVVGAIVVVVAAVGGGWVARTRSPAASVSARGFRVETCARVTPTTTTTVATSARRRAAARRTPTTGRGLEWRKGRSTRR